MSRETREMQKKNHWFTTLGMDLGLKIIGWCIAAFIVVPIAYYLPINTDSKLFFFLAGSLLGSSLIKTVLSVWIKARFE